MLPRPWSRPLGGFGSANYGLFTVAVTAVVVQIFSLSGIAPQQVIGARALNTALAVDYCLRDPRWRLSLQTHKYLGIP